jgi:hypothetical protein
MKNNRTYRVMIITACFLFAGLQAVKVIKGEYTGLEVFFLVMFLVIGILYLVLYLKMGKDKK